MASVQEDSSSTGSEGHYGPRIICNPRDNNGPYAEAFDWDTAIKVT